MNGLKSLLSLPVICIQFATAWIGAMGWHLGRIVTYQPNYAGLADTGFTVVSFVGVYATAAIVKFAWVMHLGALDVAFELLLAFVLIAILSVRSTQSHGLFCALLGSSAIVDTLTIVLSTIGIFHENGALGYKVIEVSLYLKCIIEFTKAPDEVRKAGYLRKSP